MTLKLRSSDALAYHADGRPGKIEVVPTKACQTQRDLSLAYTPGVAEVCRAIEARANDAFKYTSRGNLVAVISNGTAILGLGDIGPLAGKPVMEGKAVLFKRFADIDVFDIEIKEKDPQRLVEIIAALEPTFGGINLEDIKAPECFAVEEALRERLDIPVFHDDQHGTAIISAAGLINALELSGRRIEDITKVVVSGAGAASIACVKLFLEMGLKPESVWMYDSKGLIHEGRDDLNEFKAQFARRGGDVAFADAFVDAEVFLGVSVGGTVNAAMLKAMAPNPIVFAMANPDPEIPYEVAKAVRDDVIMATGRSDYPNQINNVLGFPFIFRGALDVHAREINTAMHLAAANALAQLARQTVPENVVRAYGGKPISFGPDYIIPKPFDHRVLLWVAPAVARAAMETGVAREPIADFDAYVGRLEALLGPARELIRTSINISRGRGVPRVAFADGEDATVLKAVELMAQDGFIEPILVGDADRIERRIRETGVHLGGVQVVDPRDDGDFQDYYKAFWDRFARDGVTKQRARQRMRRRGYFAAQMVAAGRADILVSGYSDPYFESLQVAKNIIGMRDGVHQPVGVSVVVFKNRLLLFADTAVHVDPSAEDLVNIAKFAAEPAPLFDMTPRLALLSFGSFGDADHPQAAKVKRAAELLDAEGVPFVFDGEMTVDVALDQTVREEFYPFCRLDRDANVLVFPNLAAAQTSARLLALVGGAEVLGPVHRGFAKPVVLLTPHMGATEVRNLVAMAAGQQAVLSV